MKPVGAVVHLRARYGPYGTRALPLHRVGAGRVPGRPGGCLGSANLGDGVDSVVKIALGVALLVAVGAMLAKGLLSVRRHGASAREPGYRRPPGRTC